MGDPPPPEPVRTAARYIVAHGKYLAKVVQEGDSPAQTYFLHTDMLGSIRAVTDSAGQVVARFDYEPFGLMIEESAPATSGAERYTGKPLDAALELYYFGARHYDPGLGRFITADPARDGLNWYAYCRQNPLIYVDPDGQESYVFYDPKAFEKQAIVESKRLEEYYGTDATLVPVQTEKELLLAWNAMGNFEPIDGVSLLFHGTARTINIDWEREEYLTTLPSGKTPKGADALYIGDLARKNISELRVMSCHSGELNIKDNVAEVFHATQGVRTLGRSGALSYGYLFCKPRRSLWKMVIGLFVGLPKGWATYGQAEK